MEFSHNVVIFFVLIVFGTPYNELKRLSGRLCQINGYVTCCPNYVEINGTCILCPNGFESFDGVVCTPCSHGFYGRKCGYRCYCGHDEVCDHVTGQCTDKITTQDSSTEENSKNEDFCSGKNMLYYILSGILCVGFLLGFLFNVCINAIRKRCIQEKKSIAIENEQGMEDVLSKYPQENIRIFQLHSGNEFANTSPMIMNTRKISKSGNKKGTTSHDRHQDVLQDDYLNPYQPIVTDIVECHTYKHINSSSENDGIVPKDGILSQDEYLNPYQPIVKDQTDCHPYNHTNSKARMCSTIGD